MLLRLKTLVSLTIILFTILNTFYNTLDSTDSKPPARLNGLSSTNTTMTTTTLSLSLSGNNVGVNGYRWCLSL